MSVSNIVLFGVLAVVVVVFMFRNSRKRQRDQATLASSLKPGAEIMTSGGIFGTVESVDTDENKIVLKTGPTSHLTIHRQAVGRVVTPAADDASAVLATPVLNGEPLDDPAYGERIDPVPDADDAPAARGTNRDGI